ncbi:MAG: (2Fe-2S)-binding protein [bacterium]|nr:(2Fe-2S)-binding protein [bacterium]
MSKNPNASGISRRKFLKGSGAGVVGGAVLPGALTGKPADAKKETPSPQQQKMPLSLTVNGKAVNVSVEPRTTLSQLLRDHLQLTGTKIMCNQAECGSCTVLMNGKSIYSCHTLALDAAGQDIVTVEGLMKAEELHPIQEAFIEQDGFQCGFCTPGQIMATRALLLKYPKPNREQVKELMSGNLCRCGAYPNIVKSVLAAAEKNGGAL